MSQITFTASPAGAAWSIRVRNRLNSIARWRAVISGDDLARGHVQRGVPVRDPVAGVVLDGPLGSPAAGAGSGRSGPGPGCSTSYPRTAPGPPGRIQIQPDHVTELLNKLRVGAQREGVDQMGLETKGRPDPADGRLRHAQAAGQAPGRPVAGVRRRGLQDGDRWLLAPSAEASTIRHRRASAWLEVRRRAQRERVARFSSVSASSGRVGP